MNSLDKLDDGSMEEVFTPMMVSFTYIVNKRKEEDTEEETDSSLGPAGQTQMSPQLFTAGISSSSVSRDETDSFKSTVIVDAGESRNYPAEPQFRVISEDWGKLPTSTPLSQAFHLLYKIYGLDIAAAKQRIQEHKCEDISGYAFKLALQLKSLAYSENSAQEMQNEAKLKACINTGKVKAYQMKGRTMQRSVRDHVLVSFGTSDDFETFKGKQALSFYSVITAVSTKSTHPCFIHITSEDHEQIKRDITEAVVTPFRGPAFVNVTDRAQTRSSGTSDPQVPRFPRFIIQLKVRITPEGHSIYKTMITNMRTANWTKLENAQLENTEVYTHKFCPDIGFGVTMGEKASVTFILNVSTEDAFTSCQRFYEDLLSKPALVNQQTLIRKATYGLSGDCDFVLRYVPRLDVCSASSTSFPSFTTLAPGKFEDVEPALVSVSGWYLETDKDGNNINITTPLA